MCLYACPLVHTVDVKCVNVNESLALHFFSYLVNKLYFSLESIVSFLLHLSHNSEQVLFSNGVYRIHIFVRLYWY